MFSLDHWLCRTLLVFCRSFRNQQHGLWMESRRSTDGPCIILLTCLALNSVERTRSHICKRYCTSNVSVSSKISWCSKGRITTPDVVNSWVCVVFKCSKVHNLWGSSNAFSGLSFINIQLNLFLAAFVLDRSGRYLQHPTEVVANAAHALFAYFLGLESLEPSSGRSDAFGPELAQANLREKLSIYYVSRALEV